MNYKEKIIVALDTADVKTAETLVRNLSPYINFFKVGTELFVSCGPHIIEMIKKRNGKIFLDLKLHDIPNTVKQTAKVIVRFGVDIFNVHASGGKEMMKGCAVAVKEEAHTLKVTPPYILGVTILTSLNNDIIQNELKYKNRIEEQVILLADLTKQSGLDGVVCSPQEIDIIRKQMGAGFIILTPGIRPEWSGKDDQKRTLTPQEAFQKGADYIVIGRPITKSDNPAAAAKKVIEEIGEV